MGNHMLDLCLSLDECIHRITRRSLQRGFGLLVVHGADFFVAVSGEFAHHIVDAFVNSVEDMLAIPEFGGDLVRDHFH